MAIVQCRDLSLSYGDTPLLEGVNFSIEPGERICLLGRNGTGKSTLIKVMTKETPLDRGEVVYQSGILISTLVQAVPDNQDKTIFEVVAEGSRLSQFDPDFDSKAYWQTRSEVDRLITQMAFDPEANFGGLSGGMKRRVLLAKAIVQSPDLLILDEPTNHLDIEAIQWLESFLLSYRKALLFVSHDRSFIKKIATRIFDLDRGVLSVFSGSYDAYLTHKAEALHAEEKAWARFDKKLAEEEVWIRQGVKARRTRNEGRVLALEKMRRERLQRNDRVGTATLKLDDSVRSGKVVVEALNISKAYEGAEGQKIIAKDLSLTIVKGDKIGIIGPNGAGKSTLIQMLLGELTPDQGVVKLGTSVQVAYLNQLRRGLNPESTLLEAVSEGGREQIEINGVSQHIYSYLQDFLFAPSRARAKVKVLSGGELNRLLLAKLFTQPANLLVLDEPTNDLDLETLELLEELLVNYQGTLLLVSHDREFLNNIVTSTLVSEGDGTWSEYVGGYDDYLRQSAQKNSMKQVEKQSSNKRESDSSLSASNSNVELPQKKNRLSFKENEELKALPEKIAETEAAIEALHTAMADPSFYQSSSLEIVKAQENLAEQEKRLEGFFERWEFLEEKKGT
jgi:ATP-binding cassette subfamily F protein uup